MNQAPGEAPVIMDEDEISLLDLMVTIMDNLWLLILGPLAAGLLALGYAFTVTPVFTAKTTIIPPSQASGGAAAAIMGQLGALGGLAGGALGVSVGKHMAYLNSDLLLDDVIKTFDLKKRYEHEYLTETRGALRGTLRIQDDKKTGLLTIEFTDIDPAFAAQVVNHTVKVLERLLGEAALEDARARRVFLEKQVEEALRKSYQSPQVRDAVIQGLIRQTETARLEEQQPNPNVVQVDVAAPPELKSGPRKALIAVITTLATGFLLLLFVFVRQALRNAGQDPESRGKINQIRRRLGMRAI